MTTRQVKVNTSPVSDSTPSSSSPSSSSSGSSGSPQKTSKNFLIHHNIEHCISEAVILNAEGPH